MYDHEYEAMYGLEDFYWWFVARRQLIEEILEVNRTVAPAFLEGFSERRLRAYRDHLVWAQEPREKASPWGDPDGTPAIGYVDSED